MVVLRRVTELRSPRRKITTRRRKQRMRKRPRINLLPSSTCSRFRSERTWTKRLCQSCCRACRPWSRSVPPTPLNGSRPI
ncbi:hypothetical protein DYB32_008731 [Aphanomyces invadans]|uniref:Uncharacterized protein n=1 Tax=Aphanomyces invadans TaxID=157072 RepID=A0A3R6WHP0_9STRA|nr:hypothetical protein DYB32_008731 [Aphanomyces invadans]